MEYILLAYIRANAFAENDGYLATGKAHSRDNRCNVFGELAMDYVDAMAFDKSAELPDDPGMEISTDIQQNRVDVVQMGLLRQAASGVASEPHAVVSLLQLASNFKGLNLQPAPGVGETCLEYGESSMERHKKNDPRMDTKRDTHQIARLRYRILFQ
jgi:hypothetical protein